VERSYKGRGTALDGVTACLSGPFAGGDVGVDFRWGEAGEDDLGVAEAVGGVAGRVQQGDGGVDVVAAAGEQGEAGAGFGNGRGFAEDAGADGDDGVRG
jgi:hypothetical protein